MFCWVLTLYIILQTVPRAWSGYILCFCRLLVIRRLTVHFVDGNDSILFYAFASACSQVFDENLPCNVVYYIVFSKYPLM